MINTNKTREQILSEMFNICAPSGAPSEEVKFSKREQEEIDKCAPLGAPSDKVDKSLKVVKTYYFIYKELDKGLYICISNRKPKEYFACVLCDEDKDLIMEFENHFKYNVDYIRIPGLLKYSSYRIHNLTKDRIKREMDKFIKSLSLGFYLDYISTVKHWIGKE